MLSVRAVGWWDLLQRFWAAHQDLASIERGVLSQPSVFCLDGLPGWTLLCLACALADSGPPATAPCKRFWRLSALQECADFFNLPYTGVINRPDLQDILLDECKVPGAACDALAWNGWTEIKEEELESEMKWNRMFGVKWCWSRSSSNKHIMEHTCKYWVNMSKQVFRPGV